MNVAYVPPQDSRVSPHSWATSGTTILAWLAIKHIPILISTVISMSISLNWLQKRSDTHWAYASLRRNSIVLRKSDFSVDRKIQLKFAKTDGEELVPSKTVEEVVVLICNGTNVEKRIWARKASDGYCSQVQPGFFCLPTQVIDLTTVNFDGETFSARIPLVNEVN